MTAWLLVYCFPDVATTRGELKIVNSVCIGYMRRAIEGFALSVNRVAMLEDRSLAPPSTDRAARSTDTNSVVGTH